MPPYGNPQTAEQSKAVFPTRSSDRALRSGVTDLSVRHRGDTTDEGSQVRSISSQQPHMYPGSVVNNPRVK